MIEKVMMISPAETLAEWMLMSNHDGDGSAAMSLEIK
jgi:hypothetical protein